jgi:hypothetical protein
MKAALRIGAVATGAALALGTVGSAYAATPGPNSTASAKAAASGAKGKTDSAHAGLAAVQKLATSRIEGRLSTLHALSLAVGDSKYLTSGEQGALSKQISSDVSGLTALDSKVASATTVQEVRADEVAMVDDFRVYLLMVPQVRLTEALAAESDAAATLQKAYVALSDLLGKQSGDGTAAQKSELADLQTQITAAQAAIGNEVATVLAVQPGPNASAIHSALAPASSAVKTAHADLLKARDDAKALRTSL